MKPTTAEWIAKANGDLQATEQLLAADAPVFDAVCFHAQQCVEKLLKSWLLEQAIPFPRTHDLAHLTALIGTGLPALTAIIPELIWLTTYAVEIRYQGADATRADAERALAIARQVGQVLAAAFTNLDTFEERRARSESQ